MKSMDERVWRLPGPRSFVRDIVAEHARGRHVATVLPEALASDAQFTDGLAVAVLDEFVRHSVSTRRIYGPGANLSILDTFSQTLIFNDPPVTVAELLRHPEADNTVAVVVARDLETTARNGLPSFLERMELESHAGTNQAQRLSVVAILARDQLPAFRGGASSDIAMTSIWWWARIARWDVAAHIVGLAAAGSSPGRARRRPHRVHRGDRALGPGPGRASDDDLGGRTEPAAFGPEGLAVRVRSGHERRAPRRAQKGLRPPPDPSLLGSACRRELARPPFGRDVLTGRRARQA